MINKIKFIIFSVILFAFGAGNVYSQVQLRAFNLEGGWYMPSHDYWTESSIIALWDNADDVTSGLYAGASIEMQIVKPITLRVGAGYWTKTLNQQLVTLGISRDAEFKLQYIPIYVDVLFDINIAEFGSVQPYVGLGWGLNLISREYTRTPQNAATETFDQTGTDYFGKVLAGVTIPIAAQFGFGIEARYVFGQYQADTYTSTGTTASFDAKVNGLQLVGMLKYMF